MKEAAKKAFQIMPTKDAGQSYIAIKQSPSEPFLDFIDRLCAVVDSQIKDLKLQQKMILEVVQTNANEVCKRIILGPPVDPPPTLDLLIETYSRKTLGFLVVATEEHPIQKLNWLTDIPVWLDQWPLNKQKFKALNDLMEEHLAKGHIVETNSPWNSLVFVIKKLGKDRQDQAKAIIDTCLNCQKFSLPSLGSGVNLRLLGSCKVWQTDVTHIPQFGKFKYVHVSVDTFSGAVYASAHTGEKTTDARKHLVQAFSTLGIPKVIKTNNSPTYASKEFSNFLQEWGVEYRKGIPYSPTSQAVIKRTHHTLKKTLEQQRGDVKINSPHQRLCNALFTMNFFNCSFENLNPPDVRHFKQSQRSKFKERPPVLVKDPETWKVQGPFDLVTWGPVMLACPPAPRPHDDIDLFVYWAEVVGEQKPLIWCVLKKEGGFVKLQGMMDTGSDVTLIPLHKWPSHWELQPVAGKVSGVRGTKLAMRSKTIAQTEGPDGKLTSLCLLVVDSVVATEEHPIQKLNWLTDIPVWLDQWPLNKQKFKALNDLMEEHLAKGHIVETNSPWNSLVFVIKKLGKDRQDQAKAIIDTCLNCQKFSLPSLGSGVNLRLLGSCKVWQTDVTHIPQFGKFKYVHVSVDTFSGAVYASAHTGEKTTDARKHLVQAFSTLGIPKVIKTNNSPTYASKEFSNFLQEWGVEYRKGIPYSPTSQAVIKRTHHTLKKTLEQQRGDVKINSPHQRLCNALFTMNFFNCSFENLNPPDVRHFKQSQRSKFKERPPVLVKDPETWKVQGPFDLVTWGPVMLACPPPQV
ncbi:hypothetical protein HGM15179_020112 [Zosterops borbonicus]|uniref:Integrase n=1 Tax=Zosterops borbonicus TaxID=364589 RepID=A0A8K1FYJ0_9PASS|nr:hypothetical protein HGM15179_020112 [Zosterops borbonicus]